MGKSQTKKKTQGWRHNPIRVPDSYLGHGKAAGQSGGGAKEGQLLPILNKVSAATGQFHFPSNVRVSECPSVRVSVCSSVRVPGTGVITSDDCRLVARAASIVIGSSCTVTVT